MPYRSLTVGRGSRDWFYELFQSQSSPTPGVTRLVISLSLPCFLCCPLPWETDTATRPPSYSHTCLGLHSIETVRRVLTNPCIKHVISACLARTETSFSGCACVSCRNASAGQCLHLHLNSPNCSQRPGCCLFSCLHFRFQTQRLLHRTEGSDDADDFRRSCQAGEKSSGCSSFCQNEPPYES